MSFKDNYIKFSEKFGGTHALIDKGLSKSNVNSIMAGSMPLADTAYKVAKVLGVTVEELIEEKATEIVEKHVKEGGISHVPKNPEEQHEVNRLLVILRDGNEEHLQIITHTISVLCGVRLWKKNGGIELREKPVSVSGKPERRLKIHLYKKERMSD